MFGEVWISKRQIILDSDTPRKAGEGHDSCVSARAHMLGKARAGQDSCGSARADMPTSAATSQPTSLASIQPITQTTCQPTKQHCNVNASVNLNWMVGLIPRIPRTPGTLSGTALLELLEPFSWNSPPGRFSWNSSCSSWNSTPGTPSWNPLSGHGTHAFSKLKYCLAYPLVAH